MTQRAHNRFNPLHIVRFNAVRLEIMFTEFVDQNIWWFVSLIVLMNLILFSFLMGTVKGATQVTPMALPAVQRNGKSLIIDLNTPAVFAQGHIAGAENMTLDQLSADNKKLAKYKNHPVIVTCQSGGGTTIKAAKTLVENGFSNVYFLKGGLMAWQKDNLPLVADTPKPATAEKKAS